MVVEQVTRDFYLSLVEIKDYNFMMNKQKSFDQPVKSNLITYNNIWRIATGQGDDYTTSSLLDYLYFNNCFKMIATDLSKQQALDAVPKAIYQINLTINLDRDGNTTIFFITEEAKETILDFSVKYYECVHNYILF